MDLTVRISKAAKYEEICAVIKAAAAGPLKGILGYEEVCVSFSLFYSFLLSLSLSLSSSFSLFLAQSFSVNTVYKVNWYRGFDPSLNFE